MEKINKKKKAVFFSTDALIALIIILSSVLVIFPTIRYSKYESEVQSDFLKVLSSLKIGEIDDEYVESLRANEEITDLNKTILEQIGEFYVIDREKAEALSQRMLDYLDVKDNVGIWMDNYLLAFKGSPYNEATVKNVETDRQFVSGLRNPETEGEATGYFATAALTKNSQKKYFYFGGYIGDGNISVIVPYGEKPESATLEVAANTDFNVWVNGNMLAAFFQAAESELTPEEFPLDAYIDDYFNQEENIVKFTAADSGKQLYFAGGYLRVTYKNTAVFNGEQKYAFPGIEGVINIYDSLYIPGELEEMSVDLHYKSAYDIFLDIGGVTVYTGKSEEGTTATVTNEEIQAAGLSYNNIERKTVPLRLGLYELYAAAGGNADIILITDFSGSMKKAVSNWEQGNLGVFNGGAGCYTDEYYQDPLLRRAQLSQCVDLIFTDEIFNDSIEHRIWPVFIYRDAIESYSGNPSSSSDIKNYVLAYPNGMGKTCLACSLNRAYEIFNANNDPDRRKFVILMTDGVTTHCAKDSCLGTSSEFGTKICEGLCDTTGACTEGNLPGQCTECSSDASAINNLYYSAQRLADDFDATIYTVGFGPAADDCQAANESLTEVSEIGSGKYMKSTNAEELREIYEQIAEEIISLSFVDQMSKVTGNFGETIFYPDSSIDLKYTPDAEPYGLIMTFETPEFGNTLTEGSFYVPEGVDILEANVISYSGQRWTDKVYVKNTNWQEVFSLEDYGEEYIKLGDAYVVNLPTSDLRIGTNEVKITTGSAAGASYGASASDKAIFTLATETPTSSDILAFSEGCTWHLEFYDGSASDVRVPNNYAGGDQCYYTSLSRTVANENDAQQDAVFNLLKKLDITPTGGDGKLDVRFTEEDMSIETAEIFGIPYSWSTEVQVRRWN